MSRTPEDYVWIWVTKGFEGLWSLVRKFHKEGVPVTDRLIFEITKIRNDADALLKELKDGQGNSGTTS